jgi:hypothetical protein
MARNSLVRSCIDAVTIMRRIFDAGNDVQGGPGALEQQRPPVNCWIRGWGEQNKGNSDLAARLVWRETVGKIGH